MHTLDHFAFERLLIKPEETRLLEKVPLARLKIIALGNPSIRDVVSLFAQVVLPVDTKISSSLRDTEGRQDISHMFSVMDMHVDGSRSVNRSMRAICYPQNFFCVQFSMLTAMNPADSWDPRDGDIRLPIQFYDDEILEGPHPSIIFDICRMVTHDRIQTLFLSGFELPERDFWYVGSACLSYVEATHMKGIRLGG
ncbi:hypothetical protein EDB19DRAFT_1712285 [Suillus lakei]|nr:hypothetical protein EDB19DRAFT_1712285 [Suillus lakei]